MWALALARGQRTPSPSPGPGAEPGLEKHLGTSLSLPAGGSTDVVTATRAPGELLGVSCLSSLDAKHQGPRGPPGATQGRGTNTGAVASPGCRGPESCGSGLGAGHGEALVEGGPHIQHRDARKAGRRWARRVCVMLGQATCVTRGGQVKDQERVRGQEVPTVSLAWLGVSAQHAGLGRRGDRQQEQEAPRDHLAHGGPAPRHTGKGSLGRTSRAAHQTGPRGPPGQTPGHQQVGEWVMSQGQSGQPQMLSCPPVLPQSLNQTTRSGRGWDGGDSESQTELASA